MTGVERSSRADVRARIVDAAARLLQEHGAAAVTTRRVSEEAGVQAPTIYRLLGDKDGLMEAVAEHVLQTYVSTKAESARAAASRGGDPVEDLHASWRTQVDFALANPALFAFLNDPERDSPATREGMRVLRARIGRIADAGRLRVSEQQAVDLIHSGGVGVILTLLSGPVEGRDPELVDRMWDAVIGQIVTDPAAPSVTAPPTIVELSEVLSEGELRLLREWQQRTATRRPSGRGSFVR